MASLFCGPLLPQRASTARSLDGNVDFMEGMRMAKEKAAVVGEKQMAHKEWTTEPFPDDFDDTDLD